MRYCFFDIDGTLLTGGYEDGYVPESAQRALRKLKENGHFLAIATGRSQAMAVEHMRRLGMENMVHDGGNGLTVGGKLLEIEPLDREKVCALIRECDERGLAWGIQTENSDWRAVPDGRFEAETRDTYLRCRVVEGLDPAAQERIYKAYVACAEPTERSLRSLEGLPWCRYHAEYFFVEPTDKARGIRRMMEMLGGDVRDVIVFGDGLNDLSMFTDEWTKVAMGNAVQELKDRADLVTSEVWNDGIWNACVELGLV